MVTATQQLSGQQLSGQQLSDAPAELRLARVFAAGSPGYRLCYWLSGGLAVTAAVAGTVTYFVPSILAGPAAMNGSARGTALVVFGLAVPALLAAMVAASLGSVRALVVWLGAAGYLLYNSVMFVFATPFNQLFLVYVAMLSLSIWSIIATLLHIDISGLRLHFSPALPARWIAVYTWVVVGLNLLAWMSAIVPALADERPTALLDGTGLTTNPVYVQDLAFWLPLMAVAAGWLWRRKVWGYLVIGVVLTMWVIESIGIAVDQWYGHAADPTSTVASAGIGWFFAGLAAVGCVPLAFYFRNLARR